MRRVGTILVLLAAVVASSPALSALIKSRAEKVDGKATTIITVEGTLAHGDEKRFVNAALVTDDALVVLSGPGGDLVAGIEIGTAIRLKGFGTLVRKGSECASACALAWLAGRPSFMEAGSSIGFHAAWEKNQDYEMMASSVGNAMVGAYVTKLGLPFAAVEYVTTAQPDDMRVLTFNDARKIGIPAEQYAALSPGGPVTDGKQAKANVVVVQQPTAIKPFRGPKPGQEWIQVYSRASLAETTKLAVAQQNSVPDPTTIYRYANGWFAVVIGPFEDGEASGAKDRLVGAGQIPEDSLITDGTSFEYLAWEPATTIQRTGQNAD